MVAALAHLDAVTVTWSRSFRAQGLGWLWCGLAALSCSGQVFTSTEAGPPATPTTASVAQLSVTTRRRPYGPGSTARATNPHTLPASVTRMAIALCVSSSRSGVGPTAPKSAVSSLASSAAWGPRVSVH